MAIKAYRIPLTYNTITDLTLGSIIPALTGYTIFVQNAGDGTIKIGPANVGSVGAEGWTLGIGQKIEVKLLGGRLYVLLIDNFPPEYNALPAVEVLLVT